MAILDEGASELERLARSFRRHLRAENLSTKTIETYAEAVEQFLDHLLAEGVTTSDGITREHTDGFMAWLVDHRSAATANNRYRGLHRFIRWLVEEEYLPADPMAKTKAPKVPEQPVPVLPKASLKALLATCTTRSFTDVRDRAILLLSVYRISSSPGEVVLGKGKAMALFGLRRRLAEPQPFAAPVTLIEREEPQVFLTSTPAGWFPDPSGGSVMRWWDGSRWTPNRLKVGDFKATGAVTRTVTYPSSRSGLTP